MEGEKWRSISLGTNVYVAFFQQQTLERTTPTASVEKLDTIFILSRVVKTR